MNGRSWMLGALLAVLIGGGASYRFGQLHPVLYQYQAGSSETSDVYFDADLPLRACLITDRNAGQHRISADHPLISVASYLPAAVVAGLTGAEPLQVIRWIVAATAAVWAAAFFTLLRLIGVRLFDAGLFTMLSAVSASALFWMAVPEAFVLGSISLLAPLGLVAAQEGRPRFREALYIAASAAALSMTVTNWISGLIAAGLEWPWRRAVQISANALVAVALLWAVQACFFPENVFFLDAERKFSLLSDAHPVDRLSVPAAFAFHSMVMPAIAVEHESLWRGLTVQSAPIASSGGWGILASAAWLLLLGGGAIEMWRTPGSRSFRALLATTVAAQFIVHILVGKETFLYSMHFAPLLVVVSAYGALGRRRVPAVILASVLVIAAGVNNWRQFESAAAFVDQLGQDAAATGAVFRVADRCE